MMTKNFASQNTLALKRIVYTYLLLLDNARIFLRLNHIWLLFFLWHTLPNSIYHSVHFYYSVLYHYFSTHQVLALVEFALGEDWVHLLANVTVVIILHVTIRLLMTSTISRKKKDWIGKIALIFRYFIWIIFDQFT